MSNTLYKTADCGCEIEITAAYNWMDDYIEIENVWIVKACEYHRPKDSMENDELGKAAENAVHPIIHKFELEVTERYCGGRRIRKTASNRTEAP